ncbi:glycosyltransferase [Candidatus Marinimicrobia bacterium]|nr:glycosyltransferase [Candidatus Neomarinimicrobiota bacterium]
MPSYILHISDTDINKDSRILKEMRSLKKFCQENNFQMYGLGIELLDDTNYNNNIDLQIYTCKRSTSWIFSKIKSLNHAISFFKLLLFTLRYIFKMKPRIVHCHDTLVLPIGLLVKLFTGAKLIYDAHELESDKNLQSNLNSSVTKLIEFTSWRYIDLLISVSPSICKWYEEHLGKKRNVVILNSPEIINNSNEGINKFEIRKKYKIGNNETLFIYLGMLGPGRAIEKYLKVFSSDNINSHILFVGWGQYEELIRNQALLSKNIHFHKSVDHIDVVPLVKECDYGLCMVDSESLSDYYCLPNKLFEYCFAKVPILGSDFPEISRVVKKYDFGIVCSNNIEYIAKSVNQMSLTKKDFSFKEINELSWQEQEKKLIKNYNFLLSN